MTTIGASAFSEPATALKQPQGYPAPEVFLCPCLCRVGTPGVLARQQEIFDYIIRELRLECLGERPVELRHVRDTVPLFRTTTARHAASNGSSASGSDPDRRIEWRVHDFQELHRITSQAIVRRAHVLSVCDRTMGTDRAPAVFLSGNRSKGKRIMDMPTSTTTLISAGRVQGTDVYNTGRREAR